MISMAHTQNVPPAKNTPPTKNTPIWTAKSGSWCIAVLIEASPLQPPTKRAREAITGDIVGTER